ncbi:MAG: cobalamin B12-binding domain-containing protein [Halofilum sp. (in: g-proteobacteria)]
MEQILNAGRIALSSGVDTADAVPPWRLADVEHLHPSTEALVDALVSGDRTRATVLVDEAGTEGGYLECAVGLIQPAMYRLGERWQNREISVAQEHLATALAQRLLAARLTAAPPALPSGMRALFACVETNGHARGLQMSAGVRGSGGAE